MRDLNSGFSVNRMTYFIYLFISTRLFAFVGGVNLPMVIRLSVLYLNTGLYARQSTCMSRDDKSVGQNLSLSLLPPRLSSLLLNCICAFCTCLLPLFKRVTQPPLLISSFPLSFLSIFFTSSPCSFSSSSSCRIEAITPESDMRPRQR